MTFFQQLKVLLRRNVLLKKRNKKQLFQEIFFPLYFSLILIMIKAFSKPSVKPAIDAFPSYGINNFSLVDDTRLLLVSPNTTNVQTLMASVEQYIGGMNLKYFPDSVAAEDYYKTNSTGVMAGIVFYSVTSNPSYAIRMNYQQIAGTDSSYAPASECREANNASNSNQCKVNTYLTTGFVWLQNAIEAAFIKENSSTFPLPEVSVEMMPKGEFSSDLTYLQSISSVYFVMAYSFFVSFLTVNLVAEKEKKIREGMKMMGLRDSVFWLSWALVYALLILVVTAIITILVFAVKYFGSHSNVFIFFLLMLLYGFSIINLGFLLTPFFKKAQTAGAVASFATIVVSCLYFAVSFTRDMGLNGYHYKVPPGVIWLLCLLSPVALAMGIDQGLYLDLHSGMTFSTMGDGEFPLYAPIIMLVVDIVLYGVLAVYLDHVIPGEYGPRYPPLYFLSPSYYRQQPSHANSERAPLVGSSSHVINSSSQGNSPDIEPVSSDMKDKAGLKIFNISKEFKSKKETVQAVKDFSLDMYEGQITALLGHNGAGKTTLINMLCGLSPPTRGSATIYGMDVSHNGDMERIRAMCGVCPQHNILYDELTTREHLIMFAGIKGVPDDKAEAEVNKAMKDADIIEKADTFSKNLSGGQKRKLSVAMALIGDPKIIFLDEPTAGMDPYSRRHLWALLQKSKQNRIILLTTHFMDEADILADRKAIVNHGKLRCCGSSLFLKNRFGIGYHLNMVVEPNCEAQEVTTVLKKHVDGVELGRSHAKELAFTMPLTQVSNFSHMFSALEENVNGKTRAEFLGIKSYGVSMTTLEEVFLKIERISKSSTEEDVELADELNFSNPAYRPETTESQVRFPPTEQSGSQVNIEMKASSNYTYGKESMIPEDDLPKQRFWALFKLRFLAHRRNPLSVVFQVFLPLVFVIVGCVLNKISVNSAASTVPTPLNFNNAAKQYVSLLAPLVTMDSQGDATSRNFIAVVNASWNTVMVPNTTNLKDLPSPHFLGLDLQNWAGTPNYQINYKALYNDTTIHSLPAIFNLVSSTIYGLISNNPSASINGSSLPWPSLVQKRQYNGNAFSATLILGMAFTLLAPGFAVTMVIDRQTKARGQLRVAGITFNTYWGSVFCLHLIMCSIPAALCLIIVGAAQIDALNHAGAIVSMVIMFFVFLPTMVLLTYVMSFMFDKYETCQAVLPNLFIFTSILPYVAISMIDIFASETASTALHYVFLIIDPPYTLTGALYYIDKIYRTAFFTQNLDISFGEYFKPENNVLICFIMPLIHMVWLYTLLRLFDVRSTGGTTKDALSCGKTAKVNDIPEDNLDLIEDEDEDVKDERTRVTSLDTNSGDNSSVAYVKNLRKEFRKDEASCFNRSESSVKTAVRNATFAVDRGEVFGLLGPNGAGKTTTLNMIIAETGPTRGKVMVGGYNVRSSLSEAFQAMGYCPQHDAVWELITLREHIEFYALVRGLTPKYSVQVANDLISGLKVEEHSKKKAKKLSGGTKRKLSYAISMLGSPEIVLMDEPSTGMDPQSKRFLWDTISASFQGTERGAILTTHYMEEADALCSRVAIMVNGEMQCLGPTQHLKDKYGSGYLLEIKLKTGTQDTETIMDNLEEHLVSLFPHSACLERFEQRGQYKIPKQDVTSLAQTFASLEQTKESHSVEEYSFSQATLEQVFLDFAKKQHEEGDDPLDSKNKTLNRQLSQGGDRVLNQRL